MFLNSLIAKKKVLSQEKKKGFTLVELLVVIAIIAILATVSTVGYLGFTKQAKISNDLTELTQYKTLITANTLDGYKYTTVDTKKEYTLTYTTTTTGHALNLTLTAEEELSNDDLLKQVIEDIIGEDKINGGNLLITGDGNHKSVTSIAYYHHYDADTTKGSVIWNIAEDTVTKLA